MASVIINGGLTNHVSIMRETGRADAKGGSETEETKGWFHSQMLWTCQLMHPRTVCDILNLDLARRTGEVHVVRSKTSSVP
jgi:hypothetical protein